ncbi:hypothetical protein ACFWH1_18390 [Streptomyces sp. NPDC127037]|uniref:hypothetical protein n=1 Tax=Streptomyces sp. NPDC127037 TaxID=3347113 RepID=UPI0036539110
MVGWIDTATGTFTPGALPGDAGTCDAGCVDTICRQLCDDTDGDGAADVTYSELWCVHADGTVELVLTYQDDPSVPYTPVAPVACTYGCPQSEMVMLCDGSGPFLRRYVFLAGTASFEDVALDGQTPHVVTGTVGVCSAGPDCASPSTPTATVGLCLADGTPIAVLLTRDCDGVTTQAGWVNLTAGQFNAGAPPVGAAACGDSRAFELAGILCDADPATGDVLGLVLIQYAYNPDGSLAGVTLVNPGTGDPYVLQGELRHCPTGQAQPEQDIVVLCDVQADGTAVPFVRDYRRDENTLIVGHSDYTLDGGAYLVTGTVGQCPTEISGPVPVVPQVFHGEVVLCDDAGSFVRKFVQGPDGAVTAVVNLTLDGAAYVPVGAVGQCTEPCRDAATLLLCDLPTDGAPAPTITDTSGVPYYPYTTGVPAAGAQALWDGGTLTLPAAAGPQPGTGGTVRTAAAIIQAPRPVCDAGTARVTVRVDAAQLGPDAGCANTGFLGLYNGVGEVNRVDLALAPLNTPAGWSGTLSVQADVPAADLAAGNVAVLLAFDAYDDSGTVCPPPRHTGWELSDFSTTVAYDQTDCAAQFLRNVTVDCETGAVTAVTDTTLDGAPYTVAGEVGQCTAGGDGSSVTVPPCDANHVIEACRCDDTDGDGIPDTAYVELLAVDCDGNLSSIGTYTAGLTAPYTPVAPVDCEAADDEAGADPAFGVQARRTELTAGASWSAAAWPTLQSITAVAHAGTGTVTTADGLSTLHTGEAATWSVGRDTDALLTGPLTITADTGTVTLSYTIGVTL